MKDVVPILQAEYDRKKKSGELKAHLPRLKPDPGKIYPVDCFRAAMTIRAMPERLRFSIALMKARPAAGLLKSLDMHRTAYIEHLFCHFVFTMVSCKEAAVVASSTFLNLGIEPRSVNSNLMLSNAWAKRFGLAKALAALDSVVGPYAADRNSFAHQGEIPTIPELETAALWDAVCHMHEKSGEKPIIGKREIHFQIDSDLKGALTRLASDVEKIEAWISVFFDRLLPVYEKWQAQKV